MGIEFRIKFGIEFGIEFLFKFGVNFMKLQDNQLKPVYNEVYYLIRANVSFKITNNKDDKVWHRVRNQVRQEVWLRVSNQISSVINSRDFLQH